MPDGPTRAWAPPQTAAPRTVSSQLVRYGLVGIASNLAGYLIYLALTSMGGSPYATMSALYCAGATIGFFANRRFTFDHSGGYLAPAARYFMAHVAGYLINLGMLVAFVKYAGYPHALVQAVAIVVVAGFLFVAFKLFVFPRATAARGAP